MSAASVLPIRVGVIGVGFAGQATLKQFSDLPEVQVVGVADQDEARAASVAATYGIAGYGRNEDLLARDDLDAVGVAVPNRFHAPVALAALERGLHVLCEKPLARTGAEAEVLVEAARRQNRVLQVIFNHRERGDVQVLRQCVEDGMLGSVYYAKAYWMRRRGIPGRWFVRKDLAGGGPLIDLGVHVLDMALHVLGEPEALSVSATTYAELGSRGRGFWTPQQSTVDGGFEVEDLATAFLRLRGGGTLLLEVSWASHGSYQDDYGLTLYGTEGGAEIRVRNYGTQDTLRIYTDVAGQPSEIRPELPESTRRGAVVRQFVDRILSGDWSHDGSDGLRRARIIDACYASAAEGREVPVADPVAEAHAGGTTEVADVAG
jgi:predicted dehydrogenase